MSTFTATVDTVPSEERTTRSHPIRRTALTTGAVAAVATTAVAAVAHGAGVPLAVDGEAIPLLGFAQMTLLGAVLGGLIAAALVHFSGSARRTFLAVAVVLTAASCIPSLALPPDGATKAVLVTTHLLAAAIIVPALARKTAR